MSRKWAAFSLCFSSCLLKILFDLWKCNLNFRRLKEHGMCANSVTISGYNSANAYKCSFDLSRNSHKYPDEEFEFICRKCIIKYNICMWFRMESGAIDFDAFKTLFCIALLTVMCKNSWFKIFMVTFHEQFHSFSYENVLFSTFHSQCQSI